MNIVEKIRSVREELNGKMVDINERIKVNETMIAKADGEISCQVRYTVEIGDGYDEYWDSEFVEIPRLLTDDELIMLGNVAQHNRDSGVHKTTYYDVKSRKVKLDVSYDEPI